MLNLNNALLSQPVLGTLYFGSKITEGTAFEIMDTYHSLGGRQIDTARSYADWLDGGDGASERTIGSWMKLHGNRSNVFLGTKGGLMPRGYNSTRGNLSYNHLKEELYRSLDILGTDYVDIYWLHRDEKDRPVGEIIDTCNEFLNQGLIRYIGASNWTSDRIEEANNYAESKAKSGFSMSQIQFGFGLCTPQRWGDTSVVCMNEWEYKRYQQTQLPVYAYSAQAQGFFQIMEEEGIQKLPEDTSKKYAWEENFKRAERLIEFSRRTGISASAVILDYLYSREFPACMILGCSRKERVEEAFKNMHIHLNADQWKYLLGGD